MSFLNFLIIREEGVLQFVIGFFVFTYSCSVQKATKESNRDLPQPVAAPEECSSNSATLKCMPWRRRYGQPPSAHSPLYCTPPSQERGLLTSGLAVCASREGPLGGSGPWRRAPRSGPHSGEVLHDSSYAQAVQRNA